MRLRFDVLTKTKQPELHRYWTTRDPAANVQLFRLASKVLNAIEAGVFHPIVGWQCKDCVFAQVKTFWAWGASDEHQARHGLDERGCPDALD